MWFYRIIMWIIGSLLATAGAEAVVKEVTGRRGPLYLYKVAGVLAVVVFFVSMVIIPIINPHVGIWYKFTVALGVGAAAGLLYVAVMSVIIRRRRPKDGLVRHHHRRH